jgi:hypothetical protein
MGEARREKPKRVDTDDAAQAQERETGDIYDDKQREDMLKADGITAAEDAFMQGRDITPGPRKRPPHRDTVSVELAEAEAEDD